MLGRKLVLATIVIYTAVLGCVMLPSQRPVASHLHHSDVSMPLMQGLPYCGIAIQLHRNDWAEKYRQCIDEIADTGANAVSLVVFASQENKFSTHIYLDRRSTLTEADLRGLIEHARERKLHVILMPIVLPDKPVGNDWRGVIEPTNWEDWFDSYREMLGYYAHIASAAQADVFVVGSEMLSSEVHVDEWNKTIDQVRSQFSGYLTYSSNWDHYRSVKFWDRLNLIGMNSYWELGPANDSHVSVDEIKSRWTKIQNDLFDWQRTQHKPIILLEVGWFSMGNAAHEPWDYTKDLPADPEIQKRLYEAFFESWWGQPSLGGFMIWEWSPEQDPQMRDYTPKGKPAEAVVRQWFTKPLWKVGE